MNESSENNELNDIILNKSGSASSNKKIILTVATLGVILIIVVMLMNSLSSSGTDNLPQAVLPPQPQSQNIDDAAQEPLFEEIEVSEEVESSDTDLEKIAQKLKEQSNTLNAPAKEPIQQETQEEAQETVAKQQAPAKQAAPKTVTPQPEAPAQPGHFVQVGSFSKYTPNKKFLESITSLGYTYKYHEVGKLKKVLVGPFKTKKDAKDARRVLRAKVEPGAFLVKL